MGLHNWSLALSSIIHFKLTVASWAEQQWAHQGNPSVVTTGNMGTQTKHFLILVLLAFCPITLQGKQFKAYS